MSKSSQPNLIQDTIEKLKKLISIDIQNQWYFSFENTTKPPLNNNIISWQKAIPNDKNYLVWEQGKKVYWLAQKIIIPYSLNSYPLEGLSLRLILTWWAEKAQIFINQNLVQEGDLFDSSTRILLSSHVSENQEFFIYLRLVSPSHDIGALMKSICLYESLNFSRKDAETQRDYRFELENNQERNAFLDPGLVANELTILHNYLTVFYPEKLPFLQSSISLIDWDNLDNSSLFNLSLSNFRNELLSLSSLIKKRCFYLLGHAHLDMAWLWTKNETYQVAKRTFNSVLNLQKDFPNLIFGHTSAALYEWIEIHKPDLFKQIKKAVKEKKWEILGGMWVEPEVNLLSGESLIRQLLYGQKYFKSKFNHYNKVAWLPDTFGFSSQLPQILKLSEIDYFVTGKLHWNDTTKFPYNCFWWQSPDGSKILSLMSPPNVAGVMDTNPITMTNYALDWEQKTHIQDIFWIPGVGDHGGGPTRDMLQVAEHYNSSPFFPQLKFSTATAFLDKINESYSSDLPVWNDELYLQFHRGCYTTHSDQKLFNRYSENLLYQAELLSTLATLLIKKGSRRQPHFSIMIHNNIKEEFCQDLIVKNQQKIEDIWKQVLFNQFHDILPGTSISEVFTEANENWEDAIKKGETILDDSLILIASYIDLQKLPSSQAKPLIIFNSLNWERSQVIEITLSDINYQVYDYQFQPVKSQLSAENTLLFLAEKIPSIGYQVFWLLPGQRSHNNVTLNNDIFILENQYLKVTIDQKTGNLASIFDKKEHKEVLSDFANQLQFFQDKGQYWDAWNIDPNYQQYSLPYAELKSIQWLDKGDLQLRVRVTKQFNQSEFIQDYILQSHSPILQIKNTVHWYESHLLVKVAFPLKINSDYATYEIACGTIKRTTKPQTEEEKAKWEVYGHKWVDLSNNNYGVSLLNNCKYGYDSTPNQLRLSLLRSSTWPNPKADRGVHHFTYALYPHFGDWKTANTVKKSYELNIPLQAKFMDNINVNSPKILPPFGSLLNLGSNNLILMAFKYSENDENNVVLRCYDSHGEESELELKNEFNLKIKDRLNCLENSLEINPKIIPNQLIIKPWQIANFLLDRK